ncbi:hypothetical protein D3C71_1877270 [compost metagenome]
MGTKHNNRTIATVDIQPSSERLVKRHRIRHGALQTSQLRMRLGRGNQDASIDNRKSGQEPTPQGRKELAVLQQYDLADRYAALIEPAQDSEQAIAFAGGQQAGRRGFDDGHVR